MTKSSTWFRSMDKTTTLENLWLLKNTWSNVPCWLKIMVILPRLMVSLKEFCKNDTTQQRSFHSRGEHVYCGCLAETRLYLQLISQGKTSAKLQLIVQIIWCWYARISKYYYIDEGFGSYIFVAIMHSISYFLGRHYWFQTYFMKFRKLFLN